MRSKLQECWIAAFVGPAQEEVHKSGSSDDTKRQQEAQAAIRVRQPLHILNVDKGLCRALDLIGVLRDLV